MANAIDPGCLARLCAFVSSRMALHFPPQRWGELQRRLGAAALQFGHADGAAFTEWLLASEPSREQVEILASHLTVGETYFWREPLVFEALESEVLPELIRRSGRRGRRLRIWSAGCATGEEPYSIAIAVRRALPAGEDWNVTILATDVNPVLLRRAQAGVYGPWSFRNAPPWLTEGYFTLRQDGRRVLSREIRAMVTFAYLNLAEDPYPSPLSNTNAMDVIFCRNVLMYFTPERARTIGESLYHALVPDGWLMVGAAELSRELFPKFVPVRSREAIVYRKDRRESPPDSREGIAERRASGAEALAPPPGPVFPAEPAPPSALPPWPARFEPPTVAGDTIGEPLPGAVGARAAAPPAEAARARELADRGLLPEALAICRRAIAADRLDRGLQYFAAVILQELGRNREAVAALRRALYLDPAFVAAYFTLGNLLLREGEANAARKCFANVLALLDDRGEEETVPETGGLTAGRLRQIVQATLAVGPPG